MAWREIAADLIKGFESCRLKAYPDPVTGAAPWTIGYGATGPNIGPGTVWTQVQADFELSQKIEEIGTLIDKIVTVPLTDEEKAALCSFVYNCGGSALQHSTLLYKINAGDIEGAANEFPRWDKAGGHEIVGLLNRRRQERAEFLLGDNQGELAGKSLGVAT